MCASKGLCAPARLGVSVPLSSSWALDHWIFERLLKCSCLSLPLHVRTLDVCDSVALCGSAGVCLWGEEGVRRFFGGRRGAAGEVRGGGWGWGLGARPRRGRGCPSPSARSAPSRPSQAVESGPAPASGIIGNRRAERPRVLPRPSTARRPSLAYRPLGPGGALTSSSFDPSPAGAQA